MLSAKHLVSFAAPSWTGFRGAGLIEALCDMGFYELEQHAVAQPLVGYGGDRRVQTAELIVRRKHIGRLSNDIGFARRDGTYEAVISEFDRVQYDQGWLNRLVHAYGRHATLRFAAEHGYDVEEQPEAGRTRMVLRR